MSVLFPTRYLCSQICLTRIGFVGRESSREDSRTVILNPASALESVAEVEMGLFYHSYIPQLVCVGQYTLESDKTALLCCT